MGEETGLLAKQDSRFEMWEHNWSELPEELLRIIAEKLEFSKDFIRFGAVCHPWRSVTLSLNKRLLCLKTFPWLMLPADDEDQDDCLRHFFIPFENRICTINLPQARGCHCWGSPYGWLVTFGFDQQFHLLNPLTGICLPLPHRSTFPNRTFTHTEPGFIRLYCIRKAIVVSTSLSPKPQCNDNDLLVFININEYRKFAFARPGDKIWTFFGLQGIEIVDVISFNGQVYGVSNFGKLKVCDFSGPGPIIVDFANSPEGVDGAVRLYLVELEGELHMVIRDIDRTPIEFPPTEFHHVYMSKYFDVYKFDFCTYKWGKLKTLRDHAIFIGSNTTFSLKASDYPLCKPGCIYFTDDCGETYDALVGADMGIYNLEAGTNEPVYGGEDILSRFSPPVWIIPNPF